LEVGIDELLVPGVLGADGAKTPGAPISVRLGAVSLAKPYAQLTRTAEGLVLPPLSSARAGDETPAAPAPEPAAGGQPPAPGGEIQLDGRDIALRPFNPYATAYSPYSIASGALTVATRARFQGGGYDSTTALKLLQFDLGGKEGDTLFAGQFGIPLSVALALL